MKSVIFILMLGLCGVAFGEQIICKEVSNRDAQNAIIQYYKNVQAQPPAKKYIDCSTGNAPGIYQCSAPENDECLVWFNVNMSLKNGNCSAIVTEIPEAYSCG